jgi:hypothetical protein
MISQILYDPVEYYRWFWIYDSYLTEILAIGALTKIVKSYGTQLKLLRDFRRPPTNQRRAASQNTIGLISTFYDIMPLFRESGRSLPLSAEAKKAHICSLYVFIMWCLTLAMG